MRAAACGQSAVEALHERLRTLLDPRLATRDPLAHADELSSAEGEIHTKVKTKIQAGGRNHNNS
jgi:hypothetical protein